jgi:hypothetical protein
VVVAEGQLEDVVEDVDSGLARVAVGERGGGRGAAEQEGDRAGARAGPRTKGAGGHARV